LEPQLLPTILERLTTRTCLLAHPDSFFNDGAFSLGMEIRSADRTRVPDDVRLWRDGRCCTRDHQHDRVHRTATSHGDGKPASPLQSRASILTKNPQLTRATVLAARRGVRTISTDDLIFLIRHDRAKVSRLRTFLSWKDVRKSAKDSDDKGGADAAADDFDLTANDPTLGAGPSVGTRNSKNKKAKVGLPWDVSSFYSEQVPEREDEEDEEEDEMTAATLARLKQADERTKGMNAEEYLHFSECRQASFTFRKGKRFREWAGFGVVTDSKPNDDIVDILGFLTYEIVTLLTEEALKVKAVEDAHKRDSGGDEEKRGKKRRREPGLFDPPEEARTPVGARHIQEAFRRLQQPDLKSRYMSHVPKGNFQRTLKLI
jgi:transcription initiation protein SPT3